MYFLFLSLLFLSCYRAVCEPECPFDQECLSGSNICAPCSFLCLPDGTCPFCNVCGQGICGLIEPDLCNYVRLSCDPLNQCNDPLVPTNCTPAPTVAPTRAPTVAPTRAPTVAPTRAPTVAPTRAPTAAPTQAPTVAPTRAPTVAPTRAPTVAPTQAPTVAPTRVPTRAPTVAPTRAPTSAPTVAPTKAPTNAPTATPTNAPTVAPTGAPTVPCGEAGDFCLVAETCCNLSCQNVVCEANRCVFTPIQNCVPTDAPTEAPTETPTPQPTESPTSEPTEFPTPQPTESPTSEPTEFPTPQPTQFPTGEPTEFPTPQPTESPTSEPTEFPTPQPTQFPTGEPTGAPTSAPTNEQTNAPTGAPTNAQTGAPTNAPTNAPTAAVPCRFCTFTQGGYSQGQCPPRNQNTCATLVANWETAVPQCLRNACFRSPVILGNSSLSGKTLTFTSAAAVANYLPTTGTPGVFSASATNPQSRDASRYGGVLSGQLLTALLNVQFSNDLFALSQLRFAANCSSRRICANLVGLSIIEVIYIANQVVANQPTITYWRQFTPSCLNDALSLFNEAFDHCKVVPSGNCFVCAPRSNTGRLGGDASGDDFFGSLLDPLHNGTGLSNLLFLFIVLLLFVVLVLYLYFRFSRSARSRLR